MICGTDYFTQRAIHAIAADLPAQERDRLRVEVRERHLGLHETLGLVTQHAERHWHEPETPSVPLVRGMREQANLEAAQRLIGEAS